MNSIALLFMAVGPVEPTPIDGDADLVIILVVEHQQFLQTMLTMSNVAFEVLLEPRIDITPFSKKLFTNRQVPKEMGRLLKRAKSVRMVADYKGDTALISGPATPHGNRPRL